MGKRYDHYLLSNEVELDEGFFEIAPKKKDRDRIAISNAKRLLLDIDHSVGNHYLQNYLDEFCYKFNRRYFNSVFGSVIMASMSCKWENNMQNIR